MCFNHNPFPVLSPVDSKVIDIQYYLLHKKIEALEKQGVILPEKGDKKSLIRRLIEWCGFI